MNHCDSFNKEMNMKRVSFLCPINGTEQPRSRVSHLTAPLGRARRDPGWFWSCATLTIENIRKGSSVIRQFVAVSFVALQLPYYPQCSTVTFGPKFRIASIPTFISRQFTVVVMLLPSYLLYFWKVGHISTVYIEKGNFIPK